MREVRTSEKIGLISTALGAVLTLAAGIGLSLLLDGFVKGFLALAVLALSVLLYGFFRNLSTYSHQWHEHRAKIELDRAYKREMAESPPPSPVGYDERVPLVRRRDDSQE